VDLALFILLIVVLIVLFVMLMRWEKRIKIRYKDKATELLDMDDPNPKDVQDTIKHLHLYSGRIKRDKEALALISSLQSKYGHLL